MTRLTPIVIVVIVIAVVIFSFVRYRAAQPTVAPIAPTPAIDPVVPSAAPSTDAAPTTEAPPKPSTNSTARLITITAAGFSPASVTVRKGDTVTFTNNDTEPHWPASNPHPAHTNCPNFDAGHGLSNNERYSFTYGYDRSCDYHDHLHPRLRGQLELTR